MAESDCLKPEEVELRANLFLNVEDDDFLRLSFRLF